MVKHCMSLPEYKRALKQKSHVNMHDITKIAVKPWTKETGCSLSILMSKEREEPAKLMISHVSHLLGSFQGFELICIGSTGLGGGCCRMPQGVGKIL